MVEDTFRVGKRTSRLGPRTARWMSVTMALRTARWLSVTVALAVAGCSSNAVDGTYDVTAAAYDAARNAARECCAILHPDIGFRACLRREDAARESEGPGCSQWYYGIYVCAVEAASLARGGAREVGEAFAVDRIPCDTIVERARGQGCEFESARCLWEATADPQRLRL